jgi:hypothetical protein
MQIPEPETTELELITFSFLGVSTDLNTLRQIKNAHAEQDLEVSCRIHIYLQLPSISRSPQRLMKSQALPFLCNYQNASPNLIR